MQQNMIKTIAMLSVLLFMSFTCAYSLGPWYNVNAVYDTEILNDITMINDSVLIAVGNLGTVKRSSDFGGSWQTVRGYFDLEDLFGICYGDKRIFAVGKKGTILHSDDFGLTWFKQDKEVTSDLKSVSANGKYIVTAGRSGTILFSSDNGDNWDNLLLDVTDNFNNIAFIGESIVIAVGNNGLVMKSTNKGLDWNRIDPGTTNNLTDISSYENGKLLISSDNGILIQSDDYMGTWHFIDSENLPDNMASICYVNDRIILGGFIQMSFSYHCFSSDGGTTWVLGSFSAPNDSFSISSDRKTAFIAGYDGIVIKIDVNNETKKNDFMFFFNYVTEGSGQYKFQHITGFKPEKLYASDDRMLYTSADSGITWERIFETSQRLKINSIASIDEDMLIVLQDSSVWVNDNGVKYYEHYCFVSKSLNGGKDWVRNKLNDESLNLLKISFIEKDYIAVYGTGKSFYVSTDKGVSWTKTDTPDSLLVKEINVIDNNIIYMICGDRQNNKFFCRTFDNCNSWDVEQIEEFDQPVSSMKFLNENTGWVTVYSKLTGKNNKIYKTNNGGLKWNLQLDKKLKETQSFNDIYFTDAKNGICLSNEGLIYYSTNGGEVWNKEYYKDSTFLDFDGEVYYPSKALAFICDNQRYIYRSIHDSVSSYYDSNEISINKCYLRVFPNPFEGKLTINFYLEKPDYVEINIYDNLGRKIATPANSFYQSEYNEIYFDAENIAPGMYYCILKTGNDLISEKIIVVR